MEVAVYPNPQTGTPYLCILYPCLDSLEDAVANALESNSIPYRIVEHDTLPQNAQWTFNSLTVDVSGANPVYDYDMELARELASNANTSYWNQQYTEGLEVLEAAELDVILALSTPEANRTPKQEAIVEFCNEISSLKGNIQDQLDSATTGDELNSILQAAIG